MRETIEAREAAEVLGVSAWTVYDLARRREIPHIRVGRRVLFRRSSILAWLEAREQESVAPSEPEPGKIRRVR